jgi:enamine deaminase RidA (YjgF/YER057c/UK114 family)
MAAKTRFINPEALQKAPAYTQVVEVTGPGRTIYISGQLGGNINGKLVGDDFRSQAVQVFENLKAALAEVGASFKDVVKVNSYLADVQDLPVLREVRMDYLNTDALPASTTLGGVSFAREGALLEIEVIAALPARGPSAKAQGAKRPATSRTATSRKATSRTAKSRKVKAKARGRARR